MHWKIVYNLITGIVSAPNSRDPQEGEGVVYLHPTLCAQVNEFPGRYKVVDNSLVERPEWETEQTELEDERARQLQISEIAAQRYATETGGVMFGEYQIVTDRESQQILDSAIEKIRRGLVPLISWKCGNGKWLTLDADNIAAVEVTVLSHVQGAFAWEKAELERLGLLEE